MEVFALERFATKRSNEIYPRNERGENSLKLTSTPTGFLRPSMLVDDPSWTGPLCVSREQLDALC